MNESPLSDPFTVAENKNFGTPTGQREDGGFLELETRPHFADSAHFDVDITHRKRHLADDVLGDGCRNLGHLLWKRNP